MSEQALLEKAHAYVEDVWNDVERDIDALVRIESVEDLKHAGEGMPFGPGPREALTTALSIAERLGLEAHDMDGYIGYADLRGTSERCVATIGHADIVPVGTGWHFDPLRVTRKDGYLLGRGVLDDKGPLVLSLYAAHFLAEEAKSSGRPLPYTLRCIVGTNEETGMRDVEHYLAEQPQPLFCFTPDACFPAICGEKGRAYVELVSAVEPERDARLVSLSGGNASNAIVGSATAVVVGVPEDYAGHADIEAEALPADSWGRSLVKLVATGKGGHAAMPEDARSAVGILCEALLQHDGWSSDERAFLELQGLVFADAYGKALGVDATDEVFDPLTCAGTVISTVSEGGSRHFVQGLDIRYPPSTTYEAIADRLADVAREHGCDAELRDTMVPFLTSPDSLEVQTLLSAYHDVYHKGGEAFTIGGGTYARHFERAVAFGPLEAFEEQGPAWVGPEHGPDEGVAVETLQRALEVYIVALSRLMELDLG
ncbi:MAG: Sapep family Mn(2+)-dependent dipeptidase [Atopobiaceae bacterium]|nr:Sapep family Mn(2+)-dependent dipeptidase [Atopobiaceae bacterium]